MMRITCVFLLGVLLQMGLPTDGAASKLDRDVEVLRSLIDESGSDIDLSRAKVTIDHLVDPKVDEEGTLHLLDQWAAKVRARLAPGASDNEKVQTLLSTLFEPGPWNEGRPFEYDFSDPGASDDVRNTMLSTYLETRRGQCVVMPVALVAIGQKLGLPLLLTTAPRHMIAKFGDAEQGKWTNIEATSGRIYPDSAFEAAMQIPSVAIEQGTYLRPHTPRESVALLATATLLPHLKATQQPERLLQVTRWILDVNPKDVTAMTYRADAYYLLVKQRLLSKYPTVADMPPEALVELKELTKKNEWWYGVAESLGWKRWSDADSARYLKHFEERKSNHNKERPNASR